MGIVAALILENLLESTGYFYYITQLMGLQFPLAFMLGPLLYYYVKSSTSASPVKFQSAHLCHLIPAVLAFLLLTPIILSPDLNSKLMAYYAGAYNATIISEIYSAGILNFSAEILLTAQNVDGRIALSGIVGRAFLFDAQTGISGYFLIISLLVYSWRSVLLVKEHSRSNRKSPSIDMSWILHFLLSMIALAFMFGVRTIVLYWLSLRHLQEFMDHLLHLGLSISIFYLGYRAISQTTIFRFESSSDSQGQSVPKIYRSVEEHAPHAASSVTKNKYRTSRLPLEISKNIAMNLKTKMEKDKPYLESNLSLLGLANLIGESTHDVSQTLNDTLATNFFDFVNDYRIEEAKTLLSNSSSGVRTVSQIALDSGFNSESAFYGAFKKREKLSPTQWRKYNKPEIPPKNI